MDTPELKILPKQYADFIELLVGAQLSGSLPHAFLFYGPGGTIHENLLTHATRALLPTDKPHAHPDVLTLRAAEGNQITIEDTRNFISHFASTPLEAQRKIGLIPNAEMLTTQAQHALLKTIEEPPKESIIFLATPDRSRLLPTVRSRVIEMYIPKLNPQAYQDSLRKIKAESVAKELESVYEGRLERTLSRNDEENSLVQKAYETFFELYSDPESVFKITALSKKDSKTSRFAPYWLFFASQALENAPDNKLPWLHAFIRQCISNQKSSISYNFDLALENLCVQNTSSIL